MTFKATFQWCVLTRTWDRVEESSSLCNNTEQFTQDVQRHKQKRHNELSQGMLTAGESHPAVPVPMAPNATDVCCFLRNGKRRKQTAGQQEEEAMFIRATQASKEFWMSRVYGDTHIHMYTCVCVLGMVQGGGTRGEGQRTTLFVSGSIALCFRQSLVSVTALVRQVRSQTSRDSLSLPPIFL